MATKPFPLPLPLHIASHVVAAEYDPLALHRRPLPFLPRTTTFINAFQGQKLLPNVAVQALREVAQDGGS